MYASKSPRSWATRSRGVEVGGVSAPPSRSRRHSGSSLKTACLEEADVEDGTGSGEAEAAGCEALFAVAELDTEADPSCSAARAALIAGPAAKTERRVRAEAATSAGRGKALVGGAFR